MLKIDRNVRGIFGEGFMNNKKYTEEMLVSLRKSVGELMSEKRYNHTLEVEKMAARIGEIYLPEKTDILRVAALLHDITKEESTEGQIAMCEKFGIPVSDRDIRAPKMFHAKTAAALISEKYPSFADDEVISAVRWHTTGRPDMTLSEKIIYLADYIDMSRNFEDCVKLRDLFWSVDFSKMTDDEKTAHLRDVLIFSYDLTIKGLLDEEKLVDTNTIEARNFLICEKLK